MYELQNAIPIISVFASRQDLNNHCPQSKTEKHVQKTIKRITTRRNKQKPQPLPLPQFKITTAHQITTKSTVHNHKTQQNNSKKEKKHPLLARSNEPCELWHSRFHPMGASLALKQLLKFSGLSTNHNSLKIRFMSFWEFNW